MLPCAPATAQQPDLATRRAAHLRRGINTSRWFAQSSTDYTVERLRTFTTLDDIALIRRLGFDHIRLSVDPDPLTLWQQNQPSGRDFIAELDAVSAKANAEGLAVIIDIHAETRYKQSLLHGNEGVQRFTALWRSLAAHFAKSDPSLVFFEIMNEPEQSDPLRWQTIQSEIARTVRKAAPRHTIIAAGAHWSGIDDLLKLSPLPLLNVIYTFHDYEPFAFTHQGATWSMSEVAPLRGVPYPSTPQNIAPLLSQEPTPAGQSWLEQYGLARWDAARVDRTLAAVGQWSRLHHAPVYCGEFGVYKPFAPPADRARWIQDMRVALEAHAIGWAMWDYQDNFGLVTKADGITTPDPTLLDALGLQTQPR